MNRRILACLIVLCVMGVGYANTQSGDSISVTERTTATYDGRHLRVVVSANRCTLTLTGHVDLLTVNGDHNQITIDARADSVEVWGDHNTVIYSQKANPPALNVADNGNGNTIKAGP